MVNNGASQGSMVGPVLSMLPLDSVFRKHSIHLYCYADDTRLYLSLKPDNTPKLVNLQKCLKDLKTSLCIYYL